MVLCLVRGYPFTKQLRDAPTERSCFLPIYLQTGSPDGAECPKVFSSKDVGTSHYFLIMEEVGYKHKMHNRRSRLIHAFPIVH